MALLIIWGLTDPFESPLDTSIAHKFQTVVTLRTSKLTLFQNIRDKISQKEKFNKENCLPPIKKHLIIKI